MYGVALPHQTPYLQGHTIKAIVQTYQRSLQLFWCIDVCGWDTPYQ